MERKTLERFQRLERQLADQHGPFTLFGLFYFEDRLWWDLLVAAPWLTNHRDKALQILTDALANGAGGDLTETIGGPRILHEGHPLLEVLLNAVNLEHGFQRIDGIDLPLHEVRQAYIITCQPVVDEADA